MSKKDQKWQVVATPQKDIYVSQLGGSFTLYSYSKQHLLFYCAYST